jgi:hypothetical protein
LHDPNAIKLNAQMSPWFNKSLIYIGLSINCFRP